VTEPDAHLVQLLDRCEKDAVAKPLAMMALDNYKQRGLRIAASGLTADEKERNLVASRETLRTDLCDILEPMDPPATSPATSSTHQTGEQ
jgi:hypothetical protein